MYSEHSRDGLARRLPSAGWPVAERVSDLPLVSERVDHPTQPPTMFIADGGNLASTGTNGALEHRPGVVDDQQRTAGCAPDRVGAEAPHVWRGGRQPECGVADRELRDDVVGLADRVQDNGIERRLVKLNCGTGAIDPELRLDSSHYCPSYGRLLTTKAGLLAERARRAL